MTEKIYLSVIQKELLTVLCDKELYGLQIINAINELRKVKCSKRHWRWHRVGFGSFYPALHSLEKNGLIASRFEDNPESEGARRKFYTITDSGRKLLTGP
jgi:PadR family transcriptional regulator, regulatory protein PadR